jgi:hypothetical protein
MVLSTCHRIVVPSKLMEWKLGESVRRMEIGEESETVMSDKKRRTNADYQVLTA